jgi:hypothetical protein
MYNMGNGCPAFIKSRHDGFGRTGDGNEKSQYMLPDCITLRKLSLKRSIMLACKKYIRKIFVILFRGYVKMAERY